ncbi:MAG: 2Fe-2S iron-sulfur cluster-binding protein, partial [Steroidobacteraceae bacterium]
MFAIDYEDFGTPAPVEATGPVTVEIDGKPVTVPAGTSVMRAAALAGTAVPKLCATDTLKAFGSCRMCLVEIEGRKGYPASCTMTVAPGMRIRTQTDKLAELRRGVLDLYLSEHPLDPGGARTELRDIAETVGLSRTSYGPRPAREPLPCDESNPYFTFDPEQCIVCSRCVRACDEVQGTFALTVQGRG